MFGGKTLLRNIGHLMAGSMIRSTVMVIFTIYIIRIISVHDFGVYSTVIAFSSITTAFVNFGLDTYLTREASRDRRVFLPMLKAVTKARFLLFAFSEVLLYSLLKALNYPDEVVWLTLLLAFDPLLCFLLDSLYSIFYVENITAPVALAESGKRLLLLLITFFTAHRGLIWIIISYIIADSAVLLLLYVEYRRVVARLPKGDSVSLLGVLRKSLSFSIQTLSGIFFWNVDIMMVSKLLGPVLTGFYNIGATVFKTIYFIPQSFTSVLFPRISEAHSRGKLEVLKGPILESTKNLLLMAIGIVFYSLTSLPYYIPLLFGDKYRPAMGLVGPMSLIVLFYFPAFVYQNVLMAIEREKKAVNTLIVGNVANFTLNLAFIPVFGIMGAVYGTVISQVIFLAMNVYYLRDVIPLVTPPLELAGGLLIGTAAWALTAVATLFLEKFVSPFWADNLYFVTMYLLYRFKVINVEGFRLSASSP
ncbi:polysaccharide biosynthesis C-terminal domain-containing protein [Thermococcus sp. Bubb.Bath]|uniref:oligosaccharide flippase family protein n=1 Tax=Thermococcus sp. Bubb.Bath TaxID=1638242 RepID=UPI00143B3E70|nr:polysaccharide biosynthesis C-terminal domain-containing protein [Thermococcus sp. Bubb.Bath]